MKKIFLKLIENFKKTKNKLVLSIIYLFLFSPIFITFIFNKINNFGNTELFLKIFIPIITILSFLAMIAVYYYNFFIKKQINPVKFNNSTHLLKIFICYVYIIFIFANLYYMAQYAQNIVIGENGLNDKFFNFTKKDTPFYTGNAVLFGNCLYLSITTITTIGYGDVISNYIYGRFLIAIEAMLGQILWGLSMALWFIKPISKKE